MTAVRKIEIRKSEPGASLSHNFTIDSMNLDAGHVLARRHKIDVVNPPLIAPHVDAGGGAAGSYLLLPPNVKRGKRQILPIRIEMELSVF